MIKKMENILTFNISIPCGNEKTLSDKFKKIINKCKRYKIGFPTYKKIGDPIYTKVIMDDYSLGYAQPKEEWHYFQEYEFSVPEKVAVDDIPFKIIGQFTPTEKGNIIDNYTKKDFDNSLRHKDLICEHCNTKRRRNIFYYIEKDNERKILGKNCLQDYFGLNPKRLIENMSWVKQLKEEFESYGRFKPQPTLIEFLSYIDWIVELDGRFIARSKVDDYDKSTVGQATQVLYNLDPQFKIKFPHLFPTQKQIKSREEKVKGIIAKARKELEPTNDWASNLKIAMDLDYVVEKSEGLVASVYGWLAYQEKDLERKNKETKIKYSNEYFGKKTKSKYNGAYFAGYDGERYTDIKLKVVDVFPCRDFFIVKLTNDNKDAITWFTNDVSNFEIDDIINVNFRVKEHSIYKDIKSTIINQVKLKVAQ
jgi:hypothetical protein|tara:strand:+ start:26 stop:1291 length:1266 start_codon:yes stop_codon:yes gene_type:complete